MNLFKQIETLFQAGSTTGLTDSQLLERFAQACDEAAFAALVDRHGSMVLRVCRQVLGNEADAQDASQATFLVLARRAGSIGRRESVASWLHGVAVRVAARARVAAARRRARECRGGEIMAARRVGKVEMGAGAGERHERYTELHQELDRLPEAFREPLMLCYFEGLTHEQAAARLRCPAGTIQSRLARGKAKLKARLTRRGFDFSVALFETRPSVLGAAAVPPAWAAMTVRAALRFSQGKGMVAATGAAGALAREVVRGVVLAKVKAVVCGLLGATVTFAAAAGWARQGRDQQVTGTAIAAYAPREKPRPDIRPEKASVLKESMTRTVRGIVRDEQGRPVVRAWVGWQITRGRDLWEPVDPPDRLRECKEPYRDDQGRVVPPGKLGKYYELRDDAGKWHPVHPDGIRDGDDGRLQDDAIEPGAEVKANKAPAFEIWKSQGFLSMVPLDSAIAACTDQQGRFSVGVGFSPRFPSYTIECASFDFSRQQIRSVRWDDPDRPVEIILSPLRPVRARVIFPPGRELDGDRQCSVYSVDTAHGNLGYRPEIGTEGAPWDGLEPGIRYEDGLPPGECRLELRLPEGRYKTTFESNTIYRVVDLIVPPGDGVLDLPDIRLEPTAWAKMLGHPAAEIEAVDLGGRPVKLADFRQKVIVLAFFSTGYEERSQTVPLLVELQKRFKDQPLTVLAIHDATLTSVAGFNKALDPIRAQVGGELPISFLLDRPPTRDRPWCGSPRLGEVGSGRTAETYECHSLLDLINTNPSLFVIDKKGRMVKAIVPRSSGDTVAIATDKNGRVASEECVEPFDDDCGTDRTFTANSIADTLEDLFGLPRSVKPQPPKGGRSPFEPPPAPKGPLVVSGTLVDSDNRPVADAKVNFGASGQMVTSDVTGAFHFTLERVEWPPLITVEADGLAAACFYTKFIPPGKKSGCSGLQYPIEWNGRMPEPLRMTPGATVTGRIVRDGQPLTHAMVELLHADETPRGRRVETVATDQSGSFSFRHIPPDTDCWLVAKLGGLPDQGALIPTALHSPKDSGMVDLGELHVQRGRRLEGRLVFAGGVLPAGDLRVKLTVPHVEDPLEQTVGETGVFKFEGIPDGEISIEVAFPAPPKGSGYRVSPKNKCLDPRDSRTLTGQLDRDVTDLTILVEPGKEPGFRANDEIDPTVLADFNDAKAGPITGVAPRDTPPR